MAHSLIAARHENSSAAKTRHDHTQDTHIKNSNKEKLMLNTNNNKNEHEEKVRQAGELLWWCGGGGRLRILFCCHTKDIFEI